MGIWFHPMATRFSSFRTIHTSIVTYFVTKTAHSTQICSASNAPPTVLLATLTKVSVLVVSTVPMS